jgi:acyl transferase domain-containing protein/acyl carrier protein
MSTADLAAQSTDVRSSGTSRAPIAIVGIGCRFPGGVAGPKAFWRLLRDGMDAITEIPPDRMDVAAYYDPRPAVPGKMMTRWGGFLEQIDMFDASFFGISPREADRMDPQQRLLLEVAWEALEDAGQAVDRLAGSLGGVFIGLWLNDYEARLFANPGSVDFYMTTGSGRYSASGRLSYVLGFQGPSLTVDTACSSSLVAVHLACQSLWRNECSMALAGGANVILQPHISIAYSQSKMMAPDGRCKFGDAGANGYVRSEGAGIVVLKPLAAALQDGDPIYALIRGSAVNNDGRSSGYMTTPARGGQEELLRWAYRDAEVSPGQVQYVEAHGTGTLAGDPVEVGALGSVLSSNRNPGRPCYVGSVKTNFGHTEGAAGVAGLIKTALILKHRMIPASLHLRELNPAIPWKDYPLVIPRESTPWPQDSEPAVAGVSAFGIAGTNAHVVLTEAPREQAAEDRRSRPDSACLLPLSAHSPEALASLARAYLSAVDDEEAPPLYDICFTASLRRTHHEHRMALVAGSRAAVSDRLKAFLRGENLPGVCAGKAGPTRKVVFVCPGQGSQWLGMGRQLISREAVFRESLQRCEQAMRPYVDWSLQEQLHLDPNAPGYRLNEIDVIQPSLLSIEIALAALWRSWGVEPDAVVGHSMGEVAAAFVAGALSLEDAMRIICTRSVLLRRVSGKGTMAVVALPMDRAKEALAGFEDRVSVAVSNSPRSTVLSGDPAAIEQILEKLQARDVFCRLVKVDVASHSPQMDLLTEDLLRALDGIQPREAKVPIYSTAAAEKSAGTALDARYWMRNLRQPVLFSSTVRRLAEDDHTVFIELSPHPILIPAIEETLHDSGREGCAIPSLEREKDERQSLLGSVGRLYTIGYPVDWARFFPAGGKVVSLPAYPWQRQHFWMETQASQASTGPGWLDGGSVQHDPLLGVRLPELATLPGSFCWQRKLDSRFRDWLRQHHVHNSAPVAETVYLDMASAAANAVFGERLHRISDLAIHQPLSLPDGAEPQMQFILTLSAPGLGSFQIFSRESDTTKEWKPHVSGKIEAGQAEADWLYELEWKQKPLPANTLELRTGQTGHWLIFADRGGLGSALAELMQSRGEDCVLVLAGDSFQVQGPARFCADPRRLEDMRQLLHQALGAERPSCRGIIYLWSLDSGTTAGVTAASLRDSQALTCDGVLHLIQSLAQTEWKAAPRPRLWLITRGAQAVEPMDGISLAVEQAPLWGLGRVIALEHPDLWGGLVDLAPLDKSAETEKAATLWEQILGSDGEDQVALREGRRYVVRLVRSHVGAATRNPLTFRPDATYLITGGLGSLGLHLAGWLTTQGAQHLVLTSRTGLPERSTWATISPETEIGRRIAAVQAVEEHGAKIHVAKADVADELQMSSLWEELRRHHPPLRGIIHAAGIVGSHDLVDLKADELHQVLRSKVTGAWLLHQFAHARKGAEQALDFFVLFSSGASVWGSQGLAHYAAANHFLDALAHHRAALGLPALSVNWGWWEGAGLVSEELAALFGRVGLKGLPPEQALAALAYLLETGATQKTVADVDWSVFGPIFEARRKRPLLEQVIARPQVQAETGEAKEGKRSGLLHQIQQASPLEKRPLLHNYIRTQVAEILGFASSDRIDPKQGFFKMGMDSIMTVQLRNRLEVSLGCSLPPTVAFEYPTVDGMTKFLAETVIKLDEPGSARVVLQSPEEKKSAPEVRPEARSEEELVELLAKKLEQIR